ncbi:MAG: hypothetical protein WD314_04705 [Trueperaceae bacterium]
MREKIIDIALIVTLIVVAFGITWTLLTLNRSQARPPERPAAAERSSANSTEITPLPVDPSVRVQQNAGQPTVPNRQDAAAAVREGEPAQTEPTEPRVAEAEPVPPGPVRLERIGFSFVTGGAGACGVVLEPWEHVAVSRELLAAYGCGAEITIVLDDDKGGYDRVDAVIGDTMNPSFSRTVNIYVAEDEPAFEYGLTSGTLRP